MKEMALQLRALAHPVRIKIIRLLLAGEKQAGAIHAEIGGSQPALSQNMKVLLDAKLLNCRRDCRRGQGRNIYYFISNPHVPTLLQTAERMSVYL